MIRSAFLLFIFLTLSQDSCCNVEVCEKLHSDITTKKQEVFSSLALDSFIPRYVNLNTGNDTVECLNYGNTSQPPPCASIHYVLNGEDTNSSNTHGISNTVVHLGPGTHRLTNMTTIVDSARVAIIGAGAGVSFINCGEFMDTDRVCDYMNIQVRNSEFVFFSGLTFTRCGPITSNLYIAFSDQIFIDSCTFEDNLSPPVLVHNSSTLWFNNISFINNHPQRLEDEVVHDICYFSGGQTVFFLDNRTTSGAISFYVEKKPTNLLISNSIFFNNSARPDDDVSIPRFSSEYGHGGAVNLRLLNSSDSRVCITDSKFERNSAGAHAGALAISLAGSSTGNQFYVVDSVFDGNYCKIDKCTGGAVGIDFFSDTQTNTIVFSDIEFVRNRAESSGAIALSTFVSAQYVNGVSDVVKLNRCRFYENEAFFEGTAFGAFSLTNANEIGLPIEVYDCNFDNNLASGGSIDTTAVTAYRVLISFSGTNTFNNNTGGGLSLLSSRMDLRGNITFDGNVAVFGGGIAMSGRSLILLYENSSLDLFNNRVSEFGAGIYVEFASSDFVLSVLNTGCFIRYFSRQVGIQPTDWKTRVRFVNNTARLAGAAIYANDMSRCSWIGGLNLSDTIIFQIPEDMGSPFYLENNTISVDMITDLVKDRDLATDASDLQANTTFNSSSSVSYGERVSIELTSLDQLGNFRESVWSVSAPLEPQLLGSLSSNRSIFVYDVPSRRDLLEKTNVKFVNNSAHISADFAFLQNQVIVYPVNLTISDCHPGYDLDNTTQQCVCQDQRSLIVRCDIFNRYFYSQDGLWVGVRANNSLISSNTIPGFVNCTRQGSLQGCLFKYDEPDLQCASGRKGQLCGDCLDGYGTTFDLRTCRDNCADGGGIALLLFICIVTALGSLFVLYFDFPLPNELKGVIFFAQVIGVVYRNTPYLLESSSNPAAYMFYDVLVNFLGFAMPFPICLWPGVPAYGVAFLGYIPPLIAFLTAMTYVCCANRIKFLAYRENYGFHGFYFLFLFIYKYILDTSFIFLNCTQLDGTYVFTYQGTVNCFSSSFVVFFLIGLGLVIALGLVLPIYSLYIIYQPEKMIHVSNALTYGLKQGRRYLWYGVWDIWRRLLFVVANLFLAVGPTSTVLFIDCIFILICLCVVCIVQPYKKYHINFMEAFVTLWLFGATLAILDRDDIYVGPTVSACFISLPFVYALFFIAYRGIKKFGSLGWNKANKKWHLLERSKVRGVVEAYKSVEKYLQEKKKQVTVAFTAAPEESESQNYDTGSHNSNSSQKDSISNNLPGSEKNSLKSTDINDTCGLREPLLDI